MSKRGSIPIMDAPSAIPPPSPGVSAALGTRNYSLPTSPSAESTDVIPPVVAKRRRTSSMNLLTEGPHSPSSVTSPPALPTISSGEYNAWQATIEKAVKAIVSIRFSQVSAFDTEGADCSEATGFVVDARRGIILTNRHVACSGPFVGEAIFHDHEEVCVSTIYRDPIHDFGFLRFDPAKICYMPVTEIDLRPDLARVGLDIRVVGNDAGEKLSILSGSMSRLDRNAPEYGDLTYNDFNTFYLQAASSTSGGSSGSPVINIHGQAVALQAGGHTRAATDFFFPLDRVVRALHFLQRSEPVPRGTMQLQWLFRPFDECRRLGLAPETESSVRVDDPTQTGMLVAETVVPQGPSCGKLEEGDVLIRVNGTFVTQFVPMEAILDDHIGQEIALDIERGGESVTLTIQVQDLHSITPDRYVEVCGAKFNNLSYQLARAYCLPVCGVYLCSSSGSFRFEHSETGNIIASIDDKEVRNLDEFIEVMRGIHDGDRVPVVYYNIGDVHLKQLAVITIDRHWTKFTMAVRNDAAGVWDFTDLGDSLPPRAIEPMTAEITDLRAQPVFANHLICSMVRVGFSAPARIDGFPKNRKVGSGLIVDAERGIVLVARSIVPYALGDIALTFAESIVIPGTIIFLHPTHNFSFVKYDPKLIGDTPVRSASISECVLKQGQRVTLLAFNHNFRPVCLDTIVTDVTPVTIPANTTPRFRSVNFDSITLDTPLASSCPSGILADNIGKIQGLWLPFLGERNQSGHDVEYYLGLNIQAAIPWIEALRSGENPVVRCLTVELNSVQLAQARQMGVTQAWVDRVQQENTERHQLLMIRKVEAGSPAEGVLQDLDIILAVNSKTVTRVYDLDEQYTCEHLDLTILRKKKEMQVRVPTDIVPKLGTSRVFFWAGGCFQEPPKSALQQSKNVPSRVYVTGRSRGSPAYMYGIIPTMWVTHVNSRPTHTLDAFRDAVSKCPDSEYVRVRVLTFDHIPIVISIKQNLHYWPTSEMIMDATAECGWKTSKFSLGDLEVDLQDVDMDMGAQIDE